MSSVKRISPFPEFLAASVRRGFLAFMLLGCGGAAIVVSANANAGYALGAVVLGAIGASFAAERLVPYEPTWNRPLGDRLRDAMHALINEGSQLVSLWSLPFIVSAFAFRGVWPDRAPYTLQVIGATLIADFGITLGHLLSHRVAMLWRFHAVHHSVKRMYGFNGLLKHPLHQLFETVLATAPLVLLGLPIRVASAVVALTSIQLLLQHSNVNLRNRPIHHFARYQ